ncbi:hypothetical protein WJX84_008672 [Apatococcus fuscideae]|uniref:Uncharacterized protein n=1 Tax=Apatococcus fuscideae TaxID=2026836 RepID=A0AAW1SVV4_9CHLO
MILCWHTVPSACGLRTHHRPSLHTLPNSAFLSSGARFLPPSTATSSDTQARSAQETAARRAEQTEPGSEPLHTVQSEDILEILAAASSSETAEGPGTPRSRRSFQNFLVKEQYLSEVLVADLLAGSKSEGLLDAEAQQLPQLLQPQQQPSDLTAALASEQQPSRPLFSKAQDPARDTVFASSRSGLSQDGRRAGRRLGTSRADRMQSSAAVVGAFAGLTGGPFD